MPAKFLGLFACAAITALGVPAAAQAEAPGLTGGALLECSGLPCLDLTLGSGTAVRMLVDTGNQRSILGKDAAAKLGLTVTPYVGRDGKVHPEYGTATLSGARLGKASLGDIPVMVVDLAPGIAKGALPAADGILTYVAFAQRLLRLDYKHHRVEVSDVLERAAPCPTECGTLTTPSFGRDGPPIVATTGFSVNRKPVVAQIDTLYAGTMLIYPTSVEKLGLTTEQASAARRDFPFTDGGVTMIEGHAATEGFGTLSLEQHPPLYFATQDVHTPDGMFDATVGQELFAGHVLTFDFYGHHFWMS